MSAGIVLDASVVINILGSGRAETILAALPAPRIVVEVTSGEVLRHPLEAAAGADPLAALITARLIERAPLPTAALVRFIELTGAPTPDDLDDGEAAALAAGESLGLPVALDEKKGRRIALARLPMVPLVSSGGIFQDANVAAALGPDLAEAVFSALVNARMRILPEDDAWVRRLLGPARVMHCPSLKQRR